MDELENFNKKEVQQHSLVTSAKEVLKFPSDLQGLMRQEKEVMKEEKSCKPILLDRVKRNGKQTKSLSRPDIEIKPKNIAMKMALNDRKLYKFEELLRNQESFQLESLESPEDSQYQSDFSSEDSSLEAID